MLLMGSFLRNSSATMSTFGGCPLGQLFVDVGYEGSSPPQSHQFYRGGGSVGEPAAINCLRPQPSYDDFMSSRLEYHVTPAASCRRQQSGSFAGGFLLPAQPSSTSNNHPASASVDCDGFGLQLQVAAAAHQMLDPASRDRLLNSTSRGRMSNTASSYVGSAIGCVAARQSQSEVPLRPVDVERKKRRQFQRATAAAHFDDDEDAENDNDVVDDDDDDDGSSVDEECGITETMVGGRPTARTSQSVISSPPVTVYPWMKRLHSNSGQSQTPFLILIHILSIHLSAAAVYRTVHSASFWTYY